MFCEHRIGSPMSMYVRINTALQTIVALTPSFSIVVASYSGSVHAMGLLEDMSILAL